MTEKFWMVWNSRGRAPTHKHPTKIAARTEALRLIGANPDDTFIVLESVCEIAPAASPVRITDLNSGEQEILPPEQAASIRMAIAEEKERPF